MERSFRFLGASTILNEMKSYKTQAPSVKVVFKNPALLFTTFFGAGCITPAPGTWGSLAGWLAFWLLQLVIPRGGIWIVAVVCTFLAVYAIPKASEELGTVDHGSIVIDEVVAVWFILLVTPLGFFWQLASVAVFRFFDIVKLPPISSIDEADQTGLTVMGDDLIAGVCTIVVIDLVALCLIWFFDMKIFWEIF